MLSIAEHIEPDVLRAVHFVSDALGAASTAYYRIGEDGRLPRDFVLHNVSHAFHRAYLDGMIADDPLNVARLMAQSRAVVCLEDEGRKLDPARFGAYRSFLDAFGVGESVEFVFRRDRMVVAGMSVAWRDVRHRLVHQADAVRAVQSYVEFNLARAGESPRAPRRTAADFGFTPRERGIAELLCSGQTNRDIAASLDISLATVKTHLVHIFDKMGAENRTSAVAMLTRA